MATFTSSSRRRAAATPSWLTTPAMEELVAELGSAFLSADLELTPEIREDHAAYIGSWIKVLKNDKRAIFAAATPRPSFEFVGPLTSDGSPH